MKNKFTIPMPTKDEKDAAIRHIVNEGMKRTGVIEQLADIYRALGLQCIFWDTTDCFALAAISFVCAVAVTMHSTTEYAAAVLFAVSPLFYVILTISVQWKERMSGLYDLKMTCKYTIPKITAFRMICFITSGIPACGVLAAIFTYKSYTNDYVRMLLISICSMFICAVIMMTAIIKLRRSQLYLTVPVIWGLTNIALEMIYKEKWNDFLMNLSTIFVIIITIVFAALYIAQIKKLIFNNNTEDVIYADS